jgi:preprotein translocase subunit SecE
MTDGIASTNSACIHDIESERTLMKDKIVAFFTDMVKEMNKVTWPKRKELRDSTVVVLIMCLLTSVVVWFVDTLVSTLLNGLYSVRW